MKRLFDITSSLLGLLVLSPLFLPIAVLIKREDKGPVFYKAERVGKDGRLFRMYKFRTMVVNDHSIGNIAVSPDDDPRITKFGKFLRKTKLNELPQLINVLIGDMSFVGPRPEVEQYVRLYTEVEKAILSVRPGITDYASIRFHNEGEILSGNPDPDKSYKEEIRPEKLRLQLAYVRNRSFWIDFKILVKTLRVLLANVR